MNHFSPFIALSAIALSALLAFGLPISAQAVPPRGDFVDLVKEHAPTVVDVSARQKRAPADKSNNAPELKGLPENSPFRDFFEDFNRKRNPKRRDTQSLGSGFIIDRSGVIVTNDHVIGGATDITINLKDGRKFDAKVIGKDSFSDIAVLQIISDKPLNLPVVKFGDPKKIEVGEWVFAIGTPFGLRGTVTAGIVSAVHRDIGAGPYDDFIQTDAAINRGNSGGPLFNTRGEVIGINTVILSPSGGSVGASFSIPVSTALPIIAQLRKHGKTSRGWLGVAIQQVTEELAATLGLDEAKGALVASVSKDSPAEKAGIKQGDVIIKFNGAKIDQMRELPKLVSRAGVGKRASVEVLRDGKRRSFRLTLGRLEDAVAQNKLPGQRKPEPKRSKPDENVLGMGLSSISPALRRKFNIPADIKGVLVAQVGTNSIAFEKGLRAGHVILEVARKKVSAPRDVVRAVRSETRRKRKAVLFRIWQNGNVSFVAIPLEQK